MFMPQWYGWPKKKSRKITRKITQTQSPIAQWVARAIKTADTPLACGRPARENDGESGIDNCGGGAMTVTRGFVIIILSGLAFSVGGGLIGYALAVLMPGYYRGVFSHGHEPWFDPMSVGVGLGITEGGVCGLALGAVVVLAVAWYNGRRNAFDVRFRPSKPLRPSDPTERHSEELDTGILPGG
jgi:hypothetical protein